MPYRFATQRENYADFASGRVFYSTPGHTAFPVRLAMEIFQRSIDLFKAHGGCLPVRMYDPCCGSAYHLAALAFSQWESIAEMTASDIDPDALSTAGRNLALLTADGLEKRLQELRQLKTLYGKPSHEEALASALRLQRRLSENQANSALNTHVFQADVLQDGAIRSALAGKKFDLVFSDIPYGLKSSWQTAAGSGPDSPVQQMLTALLPVLDSPAVIAVASTRQQKVAHPDYVQVGKLKIGLRTVTFLKYQSIEPRLDEK